MQKLFIVLGVIFIFVIVGGIISFIVLNYLGSRLDKESMAYVDEVIPIIVASWNYGELISRASPELLKVAPVDKIESLFNIFLEHLGQLKKYKGSRGQANLSVRSQGKLITAAYVAEAVFEKAPATIQVQIILHDKKWQILQLNVNSDALISYLYQ